MSAVVFGIEIEYLIFPLVSFIAAVISTLIGFGGGILMLVLLSLFVPVKELIAVVGLVQMASMAYRAYMYRQAVELKVLGQFMLGVVPGIALAAYFFDQINADSLAVMLAAFLVFCAWRPTGVPIGNSRLSLTVASSVMSFVSFFVGAPGPALAAVLRKLVPLQVSFVATISACLLGQNVLRTATFYSIGFPMDKWVNICVVMVVTSIAGTFAGSRLTGRLDEAMIFNAVRIAMVLAAVNLLYKSYTQLVVV